MPRLLPIRPMVSYSSGDTTAFPSSPPKTLEQRIVQPAMHA